MNETIREKIIQAIGNNLAAITTANGYNTDAGTNVFRAEEIGPESGLPVISFAPGPDEAQEGAYRKDTLVMPVGITAMARYAESDTRAGQALMISVLGEQLLGDIRAAMGAEVALAERVSYISGGIDDYPEPRAGEIAVSVAAVYNVRYLTARNNPYTQ